MLIALHPHGGVEGNRVEHFMQFLGKILFDPDPLTHLYPMKVEGILHRGWKMNASGRRFHWGCMQTSMKRACMGTACKHL